MAWRRHRRSKASTERNEANPDAVYDPDMFRREILPRLGTVPLAEIIVAAGFSKASASDYWRGKRRGRVPAANTDGYSSYLGRTMGVPRRRISKVLRDWPTARGIPKNLVKRRLLSALSSDYSRGRMT